MKAPSKYFQISSYLSLVKWNWNAAVKCAGIPAIEEPFVLAEDFAFTAAGLTFYYDQYEIGPGSDGLVTITIPYAELNGIVNPQSVLGQWVAGK